MAASECLHNPGSHGRAPVLEISGGLLRSIIGEDLAASAAMMTGDAAAILMACGFALRAWMYRASTGEPFREAPLRANPSAVFYACFFTVAFLLIARRYGLYSPRLTITAVHETGRVVQGCLTAGLLLCGVLYLLDGDIAYRLPVSLLVVAAAGTLSFWRAWWRYSRARDYEDGIEVRNVVILGTNRLSYALSRQVQLHRKLGYEFLGFVSTPGAAVNSAIAEGEILGGVEEIRKLVRRHFVDELVIADFYPTESAIRLVQDARALDIDVRAIAGYYGDLTTNAPVEYLGIFPMAALHRREPRVIGPFFKRAMDIVVSGVVLTVWFPLILALAAAVKLESRGPGFYISERIGKRGRVFRCYKIRTMVTNAEAMQEELSALNERDGVFFKMANDPRVTRLGRLLRKHSLDELPQLLNVLRGEMSLVGPRPPIASEVEQYELEHFRKLEVLPGITGLWQVRARRDASFAKCIALDTAYVENWTFWLDIRILLETVSVLLSGTGN